MALGALLLVAVAELLIRAWHWLKPTAKSVLM